MNKEEITQLLFKNSNVYGHGLKEILKNAKGLAIALHRENDKKEYEKEKIKQVKELKERLLEGHEHPSVERD